MLMGDRIFRLGQREIGMTQSSVESCHLLSKS